MFTDIVASTDLVAAIGDAAWVSARGWHNRALRELFTAHAGEEITHAGDGFFVAFAEVSNAIACAVEIQRSLDRHRHEHGFALPVRIALHATTAVRTTEDYAGRGVHEAARIAALAGGDEILASRAAFSRGPAELEIGEPRSVQLKGSPSRSRSRRSNGGPDTARPPAQVHDSHGSIGVSGPPREASWEALGGSSARVESAERDRRRTSG